jgi:hypothetical protein
MVAEVVPEHRRVEAGALLYTSAPLGLFLATQGDLVHPGRRDALASRRPLALRVPVRASSPRPSRSSVRLFVKEPERWAGGAGSCRRARGDVHAGVPRAHALRA